jgi:hypothetical protein
MELLSQHQAIKTEQGFLITDQKTICSEESILSRTSETLVPTRNQFVPGNSTASTIGLTVKNEV